MNWKEQFDELATYNEDYKPMLGCCGGDYCRGNHNDYLKSFIQSLLDAKDKHYHEEIESMICAYTDNDMYTSNELIEDLQKLIK